MDGHEHRASGTEQCARTTRQAAPREVPIGTYLPTDWDLFADRRGMARLSSRPSHLDRHEFGSVVGFDGAGRGPSGGLACRARSYFGVGVERLIQPRSAVRAPVVRADSPPRRVRSSGDSVTPVAATFSSR